MYCTARSRAGWLDIGPVLEINLKVLFSEFVYSIFLHSEFFVGQNWLISVLNHLVDHQNTQLNAKN